MISYIFVASLAAAMGALLFWGCRTLPAERWQMIASVPIIKREDGSWRGLNLTFYGFFSATAIVFGIAIGILLMASLQFSMAVSFAVVGVLIVLCVPASRLMAAVVEKKKDTFTIAGAAFVAALLLPPLLWLAEKTMQRWTSHPLQALPVLDTVAIGYALAEAVGRLACISFGCCYGLPLRQASPLLEKLFRHCPLVFRGATKKAAYASGLDEVPLIPVQALTSAIFAFSGLIGLSFFLEQKWRLAVVIPAVGTWGWRAIAESLRADYRGASRISVYQVMSIIAMAYLTVMAFVLPASGPVPNLNVAFAQFRSAGFLLLLQSLWIGLFAYYGRSRVTGSVVAFHVTCR